MILDLHSTVYILYLYILNEIWVFTLILTQGEYQSGTF
jgi:hypothetical protein